MNDQQTKLFEVEIGGLKLKLRSTHDEGFVRRIADNVNNKLGSILKSNSDISFQNALILSALNLAEDNLLLKQQIRLDLENLESKSIKILSHLESKVHTLDN